MLHNTVLCNHVSSLACQIFEENPNVVKNYGIWLRYDSRSGTHNMYKEFRDITLNNAIDKLCM